jgi:short subunit dehydrogenase-like uncharacterized protein
MADTPEFDLVLYGATGFTGRLVAEYLAAHAPDGITWAVAGRNPEKLAGVMSEVGADIPQIRADAGEPASLREMASRARVVITTVGPYDLYGMPLVEACADAGTDYVDLTGETQFIRRSIDTVSERARETGARIVHCCGFDSIPSDLGVWMLNEHLRTTHERRLQEAKLYVGRMKGGASGGTIASMLRVVELAGSDRSIRRILGDPYALNPEGTRGDDGSDQNGARYDPWIGAWTGPFVMAAINTRIVRRSNALLGHPYGRDFRYAEVSRMPSRLAAYSLSAGLGAFVTGVALPPTRALLRRFLPAPGEGPDRAAREAGYFEISILGRAAGEPPLEAEAFIRGEGDPGYLATSRMLAESSLCLALEDVPAAGGVHTPASAMAAPLLDRLRAAGMTFEVRPR